jgi:hypothetical protein
MASFKRKGEMTRVHFELIAQVLVAARAAGAFAGDAGYREVGERFADALGGTNPEFSRAKFLATLGINAP